MDTKEEGSAYEGDYRALKEFFPFDENQDENWIVS